MEKQNRTARNQINFRVTEEEYAVLKRRAEMAGLSPSMYAKKQALTGKVKAPVITKDVGQLILPEISKIGSNVNQIARKLNAGDIALVSEFKEIQAEFETLWAYVLEGKKPKQGGAVQAQPAPEQQEQKEEKPEITEEKRENEVQEPPTCKVCGARLVEGTRKKDNAPIMFCPNWQQKEMGVHTVIEV